MVCFFSRPTSNLFCFFFLSFFFFEPFPSHGLLFCRQTSKDMEEKIRLFEEQLNIKVSRCLQDRNLCAKICHSLESEKVEHSRGQIAGLGCNILIDMTNIRPWENHNALN